MRAITIIGWSFLALLTASSWTGPAFAQSSGVPIVLAQANQGQQRGLFNFLFGGGQRRNNDKLIGKVGEPPNVIRKQRQRTGTVTKRRSTPAPSAPKEVVAVEKTEDAKRVVVGGDFMAKALAKGLGEAFAENPGIVVIDASNGSSGLVRDDFYDWNARLPEIAEAEKADLVVMMIGANDRQDLALQASKVPKGTPQWSMVYGVRVTNLIETIAATGKPGLWVGLAPVQSNALSRDYSNFNSIYREKSEATGFPFVATWDGFADDEGRYVANGPDINGQQRGLRTSDGLNFTSAGRRKLAFFVERDVLRLLKSDNIPVIAALTPGTVGNPAVPEREVVGPMMSLDAVSLASNPDLSNFGDEEKGAGSSIERIVGGTPADQNVAQSEAAPRGRADDATWPLPQ